jgi:hypothetical protein
MQLVVVLYKLFLLRMQPLPFTHVSSVSTSVLLVTGTNTSYANAWKFSYIYTKK